MKKPRKFLWRVVICGEIKIFGEDLYVPMAELYSLKDGVDFPTQRAADRFAFAAITKWPVLIGRLSVAKLHI